MEKIVSHQKLQKKKQRELAAKQRGSWGSLNPVTRKPPNPKAYNRKKTSQWRNDPPNDLSFLFFGFATRAGKFNGISIVYS